MAKPKAKNDPPHIDIVPIEKGHLDVCVLGESPIILNRMSQKALHELLLPAGRKTAADRAANLKHNPMEEFRASPYRIKQEEAPTLIGIPATAFKSAMGTAALDLPGAKRTQVGRLTWVNGFGGMYVPIYGVPQVFMAVVRSADQNRTPDVRTRAIIEKWATVVSITYIKPLMLHNAVANLLAAAGLTAGVGDWRPEKGKGNFGQFRLVNEEDPEFKAVLASGNRVAQVAAMETPSCFDDETETLLAWYDEELARRQEAGRAPKPKKEVA